MTDKNIPKVQDILQDFSFAYDKWKNDEISDSSILSIIHGTSKKTSAVNSVCYCDEPDHCCLAHNNHNPGIHKGCILR